MTFRSTPSWSAIEAMLRRTPPAATKAAEDKAIVEALTDQQLVSLLRMNDAHTYLLACRRGEGDVAEAEQSLGDREQDAIDAFGSRAALSQVVGRLFFDEVAP
jgi:hypothetical protein